MTAILPGGRIGILGGGQLGRMMAIEARRMGYRAVVLDPDACSPAAQVADACVVGSVDDVGAALKLAERVDVVVIDTEHVPAGVLERIESLTRVHPSAASLGIIQDRLTQKRFLQDRGFPVARFEPVSSADELGSALAAVGLPAVLKTRRAGYDGKGQARIRESHDAPAAWNAIGQRPAVLEAFVPFRAEVSGVVGRDVEGRSLLYPLAENVHRQHVLHTTRVPARVSDQTRARAEELAAAIAEAFDLVGVTAVEMFVLDGEQLVINEIAPRVHNSGHYTLGACATSQFEQHLRGVCGLPLGDASLLHPGVMANLLGDLWSEPGPPRWDAILRQPDVRLHLYGKAQPKRGRKMGHLLVLDADLDRAEARIEAMLAGAGRPAGTSSDAA